MRPSGWTDTDLHVDMACWLLTYVHYRMTYQHVTNYTHGILHMHTRECSACMCESHQCAYAHNSRACMHINPVYATMHARDSRICMHVKPAYACM